MYQPRGFEQGRLLFRGYELVLCRTILPINEDLKIGANFIVVCFVIEYSIKNIVFLRISIGFELSAFESNRYRLNLNTWNIAENMKN